LRFAATGSQAIKLMPERMLEIEDLETGLKRK